jgi:hypothetical protein
MSIHIVTHAYAKELPQYGAFLRTQLSSLLIHPPKIPIEVTICCTHSDEFVLDILGEFRTVHRMDKYVHPIFLDPSELFRRSIGRNMASLETESDIVWFADVDHFFGDGCLDSVWDTWNELEEKPILMWPKSLQISKNHGIGDHYWNQWPFWDGPVLPDLGDFETKIYTRAVGGVQIADGNYCREHGYLNDNKKWQRGNWKTFGDFRDDVKFRSACMSRGSGMAIDIPNLYRLRHSKVTYR